jgi:hypothetical protein
MHIIYLLFLFAVLFKSCDPQILVIFELFRARGGEVTNHNHNHMQQSNQTYSGIYRPIYAIL